ncbi:MAG: CAP domain-containing protein [Alphaproteobacteria bacterium HGW-Alphaproteobacteria-2]|nr:MAG: CAP domain-containing protein [Alphaproteobacteria bacterium HGW-Alphaproteobacteria-2]
MPVLGGAATSAPVNTGAETLSIGAELNRIRHAEGLAPLTRDPALDAAAARHAADLSARGVLSHRGADGTGPRERMARQGYAACLSAENVARGQRDAAAVMAAWMDSAPHRRNILLAQATDFGAARGPGNTWVLKIARPCR